MIRPWITLTTDFGSSFYVGQIVKLTNSRLWNSTVSPTFHGRDIMVPVAATIAGSFPIRARGTAVWVSPESHIANSGLGQKGPRDDRFKRFFRQFVDKYPRERVERTRENDEFRRFRNDSVDRQGDRKSEEIAVDSNLRGTPVRDAGRDRWFFGSYGDWRRRR